MMNDAEQWYYTNNEGAQQGPVSKAVIEEMMSTGSLAPYHMVWKQGMDKWQMVSQVNGLKAKEAAQVSPPPTPEQATVPGAQTSAVNPYSPPTVVEKEHSLTTNTFEPQEIIRYGGIRRLSYFISFVILFTTLIALIGVFPNMTIGENSDSTLALSILLVIQLASLILMGLRLKNTGCSPWWVLLVFLPIANIVIGIRCLVAQEGYSAAKKLDLIGRVLVYVFLGIPLLLLGISLLFMFAGAYKKGADRAERELQKQKAQQEQTSPQQVAPQSR